MVNLSSTEENYLKAIYKLSVAADEAVSTNAIAAELETSAASVTDMMKRLSEKELIHYEKYKGVRLTISGQQVATSLVRKHRLWETFLVNKLKFTWDEVHPIAEQLEHIQSEELVNRLDSFLEFPKVDPHGDPIPDRDGNISYYHQILVSEMQIGDRGVVVGVKDHSSGFLRYLEQLKLVIGAKVQLVNRYDYDQSLFMKINDGVAQIVTQKVCNNLYIKPEK